MEGLNGKKLFANMPKDINSQRLEKHIKDILNSVPTNTKAHFKSYGLEHEHVIVLLLKNEVEDFRHIHYFFMDIVDKKHGEYLYFSMPESTLEQLFYQLKDWTKQLDFSSP